MVGNFFRLDLPFDSFDTRTVPYSEDKLKALRAQYNEVCSFFRDGDLIFISPEAGQEFDMGEPSKVIVIEKPDLVEKFIRHLLFREFRKNFPGRSISGFAPLEFTSSQLKHDLLNPLLPSNLKGLITYRRKMMVSVTRVVEKRVPAFGLLIDLRYRWYVGLSFDEMLRDGLNGIGSSVVESVPVPGLVGILTPEEKVLGEVVRIEGPDAIIKTQDGLVTRSTSELFIQRSKREIERFLLSQLEEDHVKMIFDTAHDAADLDSSPDKKVEEIVKVAKALAGIDYVSADNYTFKITPNWTHKNHFSLEPSRLVFGRGASGGSVLSGLGKHGPYDAARFSPKSINILVIHHAGSRGYATTFCNRLREGIASSKYFQRGLKSLFHLHDVQFSFEEVSEQSPEDYESAIRRGIGEAQGMRFNLAIVECSDDSNIGMGAKNPYLRAKAKLMAIGIPVQCIRTRNIKAGEKTWGGIMGPISLQVYAKLGGVPWLLPRSESEDFELIVGIGNRWGKSVKNGSDGVRRVVGLTTFFSGDGRYLLGKELSAVPYEDYFNELLNSLKRSIGELSKEYGWARMKSVRIVFHVFKPIKNIEADVVQNLLSEFPEFTIRFAFVTIALNHSWNVYRSASLRNGSREVVTCDRGDNVVLDDNRRCLLFLRGKTWRLGRVVAPNPVLIELHNKSTYLDLQFMAQQILDFSYLFWRSFFPCEKPVTIRYSELMADMSAELDGVPEWNPLNIEASFQKKQWYL